LTAADGSGGATRLDAADLPAVREALRAELTARGYSVASDTVSLRRELYVRGPGDHAAAIFEFKSTAAEALESMYKGQGRWTPELPPRFAVLPAAERTSPEADLLVQAGFSVLFMEVLDEDILFLELESALETRGRPVAAAEDDRRTM
jgi:hypothetical protein